MPVTCTPNALAEASKCYTCFSTKESLAAQIYALCYHANHLTPPACQISWTPSSVGGVYNGGIPFADLAAFSAIDPTTVTALDLGGNILTSISCIRGLPNLKTLSLNSTGLLGNLDLSGCAKLELIDAGGNSLTSITLTGCVALKNLLFNTNLVDTLIDVADCAGTLIVFDGGGNSFTILDLSGFHVLQHLDLNTNSLGTLTITGDFAITYLDISGNPAVVVIGP